MRKLIDETAQLIAQLKVVSTDNNTPKTFRESLLSVLPFVSVENKDLILENKFIPSKHATMWNGELGEIVVI